MANLVVWVEIPVLDMDRAANFYEKMMNAPTQPFNIPGAPNEVRVLSSDDDAITAGLVLGPGYEPSPDAGPLVYLNMGEDLQPALDRAEQAGARILRGKQMVGKDMGFDAVLIDSEGNRIALHSAK